DDADEQSSQSSATGKAELLALQGDCNAAIAKYKEAQSSYAQALALNPQHTQTYAKLAQVIALRPQDVMLKEEIEKDLSGTKAEMVAKAFPTKKARQDAGIKSGIKTVMAIHRIALSNAAEKWLARRNAAISLMEIPDND